MHETAIVIIIINITVSVIVIIIIIEKLIKILCTTHVEITIHNSPHQNFQIDLDSNKTFLRGCNISTVGPT